MKLREGIVQVKRIIQSRLYFSHKWEKRKTNGVLVSPNKSNLKLAHASDFSMDIAWKSYEIWEKSCERENICENGNIR
jgi:hypothetical protein